MKECPHCKKKISERAIKCKYCKKYLENEDKGVIDVGNESEKSQVGNTKKKPSLLLKILGWTLILLLGGIILLMILTQVIRMISVDKLYSDENLELLLNEDDDLIEVELEDGTIETIRQSDLWDSIQIN